MLKYTLIFAAIAGLVLALAPAAQAVVLSDSWTGDYRIIFMTLGTRDATSTTIGDYDTFVSNEAGLVGSTQTKDLATTWQVLGSTEAVDAIDHTGTTGAGTGIHIYTPQGSGNYQLVATSYTDLWDSSILTGIHYGDGTEAGDGTGGERAWTGTQADGTACDGSGDPSAPLGGLADFYGVGNDLVNVGEVRGGYIDSNWIEGPNANMTGQRSLMGISGVIPEPATMSLLALGGLALLRRRRRA